MLSSISMGFDNAPATTISKRSATSIPAIRDEVAEPYLAPLVPAETEWSLVTNPAYTRFLECLVRNLAHAQ